MRKVLFAGLWVGLVLTMERDAPSQQQSPPTPASRLVTVTLERAPGDLGKAMSTGSLVVGSTAKGKEILLFDSGAGELRSFLETGKVWSKVVRLRGHSGGPFSPAGFRMAVNGDLVAFAEPSGVNLFNRETGEFVAAAPYLHHVSGLAASAAGSWIVSLIRLPFPEIAAADKEKFGGPAPRFVLVDDKLEIQRKGLPADLDRTPNQSAARALRLAASTDRIFAAEIANYKVYELNRRLKLQATYIDPRLKLEEGVGLAADPRGQERLLAEARRTLTRAGTNAASRPVPPSDLGQSTFFSYQTVIWDIAWDPYTRRLLLLLANGVASDHGALDLLDPTTGEVQRLLLDFPQGTPRLQLSQLVVGSRYLWLRSHVGSTPTFRLDRTALEQARIAPGVERSPMASTEQAR